MKRLKKVEAVQYTTGVDLALLAYWCGGQVTKSTHFLLPIIEVHSPFGIQHAEPTDWVLSESGSFRVLCDSAFTNQFRAKKPQWLKRRNRVLEYFKSVEKV